MLNELERLPHVDELIAQKRGGAEKEPFRGDDDDVAFHRREYDRLVAAMHDAQSTSPLPERLAPDREQALHDFLVRVRLLRR